MLFVVCQRADLVPETSWHPRMHSAINMIFLALVRRGRDAHVDRVNQTDNLNKVVILHDETLQA